MWQTTLEEKESGNTVAAVNCYFMSQDGSMFKAQVPFSPYFYVQIKVRARNCHHRSHALQVQLNTQVLQSVNALASLSLESKMYAGARTIFASSKHRVYTVLRSNGLPP